MLGIHEWGIWYVTVVTKGVGLWKGMMMLTRTEGTIIDIWYYSRQVMLCVMSENVDSVRGWAMVLEYIRLRTFAVSVAVLNLYEVLDIVITLHTSAVTKLEHDFDLVASKNEKCVHGKCSWSVHNGVTT